MQATETIGVIKTIGVRESARHVTRHTLIKRAKRDAVATAERFARDNEAAINLVRNFYSWRMQHVLSLYLDVERQRFMQRHRDLDPETATRIWFDTCETHSGTSLVMADLEYERDRREGRSHHWKRYSWAGDVVPITGPQLEFVLGLEDSATA
jgi:hypothetical protein